MNDLCLGDTSQMTFNECWEVFQNGQTLPGIYVLSSTWAWLERAGFKQGEGERNSYLLDIGI